MIVDFFLKKLDGVCFYIDCFLDSYWLDYKDLVCVWYLGYGDYSVIDEYEWFGFYVVVKIIFGVDKDFVVKKVVLLVVVNYLYVV